MIRAILLTLLLSSCSEMCSLHVGQVVYKASNGIMGQVKHVYRTDCEIGVSWSDGRMERLEGWRVLTTIDGDANEGMK